MMEVLRAGAETDGDAEVQWRTEPLGSGERVSVTIRNGGPNPVRVLTAWVEIAATPGLALSHGYQSWSPTWIVEPARTKVDRSQAPDWIMGTNYAIPDAAASNVVGDQYLVTDQGVIGWLGASHLSTVRVPPQAPIEAIASLDNIELGPGEERVLDALWIATGDPGTLYSEFASLLGDACGARTGGASPFGWCSWYEFFGEVTPEDVRRNLRLAAGHSFDLVQVDDGYQAAIGDWLDLADGWSEVGSMATIAEEIGSAGMSAGIWTAPFLAAESSAIVRAHPDWVPRHPPTGKPSKAMYNPAWDGWALALDTTNPAVLDHLRSTFATLREWGFGYHKIDFCYSAALQAERHDPTKTRAEALRMGLEAVREGIGDDAYLLGCGCPFGPAIGLVDAMRVSPDVAPYWEERAVWPGLEGSGVAAENAVRASALRAPLHRRLFVNDPDCVLLRPTNTQLSADQRRTLADSVLETGAFVVLSDDMARYGDAEWEEVERLRESRAAHDHAIDLPDPFASGAPST